MRGKKLRVTKRCILEKMKVLTGLTLGAFILFFILSKSEADAEIIDKIVAVVNEEIILLSELREISTPYLEKMKSEYSLNYDEEQVKETERRILNQLIDEKLVKQEVTKLETEVTEKEVDMAIRDVREDNKLSEEQFKQALSEEGVTLEVYREQLKDQMEKVRLLEREIKSKVQIKEEEIEEYYKEHMDSFNVPPEVRFQQILLIIPPEASEQEIGQIRVIAEGVLQKIRNGEDFTAMVRLYSQDASAAAGGDIGFIKQGELIPALNEVAFSLNADEVSSVIQSSLGFHILKVLEKRERKKMTKEERWKEIEDILYNQKLEDKFKQWLKVLRKKSYIKINL
jgi:peptidyl-prolyl cis-trans isomerase SurA